MAVRQVKTQISPGICPVWTESLLCAQLVAKGLRFLHVDSEDSDQTGWLPRLIWVFAGRTLTCWFCHVSAHLWSFYLNLTNKRRRKVIIRRLWLLRSTAITMTWRLSNVMSANQLLHLSNTSLTRNIVWTSVVHRCMPGDYRVTDEALLAETT